MNRREFIRNIGIGLGVIGGSTILENSNEITIKTVQQFVNEAVFDIPQNHLEENEGKILHITTCCVDGRRPAEEEETPPECAMPGADEGVMENILGTLNEFQIDADTKKIIIEEYIKLRGGIEKLHFHTDEHTAHENPDDLANGCKHFKLSSEYPNKYNLERIDLEFIIPKLKEIEKAGGREILYGDHKEKAVIIIDDEKIGLRHETDTMQAFIYNRALHTKFLKILAEKIVAKLKQLGKNIDLEKFTEKLIEINNKQLMATLTEIAKGKKIFEIKAKNTIKEIGKIK